MDGLKSEVGVPGGLARYAPISRYPIFRFLHLFEEIARTSLLNCIFFGRLFQHDRKSETPRISPILIRKKARKLKIPKFLSLKSAHAIFNVLIGPQKSESLKMGHGSSEKLFFLSLQFLII